MNLETYLTHKIQSYKDDDPRLPFNHDYIVQIMEEILRIAREEKERIIKEIESATFDSCELSELQRYKLIDPKTAAKIVKGESP